MMFWAKILVRLEELAVVDDGPDHILHVVGLAGLIGDDAVQVRRRAPRIVAAGDDGWILHVVGGQEGEQPFDLRDAVAIVLAGEVRHPALLVVGLGAPQGFEADLLARHGLDDLGAGDEHVAGVLDHENIVGHGRRVDRAARGRPHDGRDLRDDAGAGRVAEKNLAVAGQGVDRLLDAGPARVVHADERHPGFQGQIHDLADLPGVHLAETAGAGGEILREGEHRPSFHQAVAGDDPVGGDLHFFHVEIGAAMGDEHVQLAERTGVKEQIQPLARGELALFLVLGHGLVSAHLEHSSFAGF